MILIFSVYSGNWEQILCFLKMEKEPRKHTSEAYMDSLFFCKINMAFLIFTSNNTKIQHTWEEWLS